MRHFLVMFANTGLSNSLNIGSVAITSGIEYLIRQVDPDALFYCVEMMHYVPEAYALAREQADTLCLCGSPRLGMWLAEYYDWDFWSHVFEVRKGGARIADLYCGVHIAQHNPSDGDLKALGEYERAQQVLRWQKELDLVIARDPLYGRLAERAGVPHALLPCSSWWAHRYWGIQAEPTKRFHAIAVRIPARAASWVPGTLVRLQRRMATERDTLMLTIELADYHRMREAGATPLVQVADFASLLRIYSQTDVLVSLRVHSSIPGLSVGARLLNVACDSRSATLTPFGAISPPLEDLQSDRLDWHKATAVDFTEAAASAVEKFATLFAQRMLRGRR
jgi:hypothetical protein